MYDIIQYLVMGRVHETRLKFWQCIDDFSYILPKNFEKLLVNLFQVASIFG